MKRILLVISNLALIMTGCQATLTESIPTQTSQPVILPATWTPELTSISTVTSTSLPLGDDPTLTPTPTNLPPTTTQPTSEPKPTRTRIPQPTPIELVPGDEITIVEIEMFTPQRGWALGYQEDHYAWILFTDDGGLSWADRTPAFYSLGDVVQGDTTVSFQDEKAAWVLFPHARINDNPAAHRVYRTTDSGETWSSSDPLPFPLEIYYLISGEMFFLNSQQGWLRVHLGITHMHDISYLFQTSDGGQTWVLINPPGNSMIEALINTEMAFANPLDGWMLKDSLGGFTPLIEGTSDGGLVWKKIILPAPDGDWVSHDSRCIGFDPVFFEGGKGSFLLNCIPYNIETHIYDTESTISYLYSSSDRGMNWEIQELPGTIEQLVFLDETWGFAQGRDHFRTRDGGISWEKIKSVTWSGEFSFISTQEGWAVARDGEDIALVHTADGGRTYQIIKPVLK